MNRQAMPGGNGFALSRNLNPTLVRVESLKPLGRETRKHPPSQIRKLQASITAIARLVLSQEATARKPNSIEAGGARGSPRTG